MRFISLCSGIDAASVAWKPLGWEPLAFAEIEKFPSAVLAHHYPDVPNLGDLTKFQEWPDFGTVDLVCGGTPCQDASIGYSAGTGKAGAGLDGERSGLAFSFCGVVERYRPVWFVWENVRNVLSHRNKPGFLRFAEKLAGSGYHLAYRVLDGRLFGLEDQPRPRVFMVGHRGDPRAAAAVLFEPEGSGRDCPQVQNTAPTLTARGGMAFDDRTPCILEDSGPRIATPLEWERACGFPDNYTRIPWRGKAPGQCPDGPRYRAVGNSWDVSTARWIGTRIQAVSNRLAAA
jgi:DNA (cytosine-5)-methyltransferase 1